MFVYVIVDNSSVIIGNAYALPWSEPRAAYLCHDRLWTARQERPHMWYEQRADWLPFWHDITQHLCARASCEGRKRAALEEHVDKVGFAARRFGVCHHRRHKFRHVSKLSLKISGRDGCTFMNFRLFRFFLFFSADNGSESRRRGRVMFVCSLRQTSNYH